MSNPIVVLVGPVTSAQYEPLRLHLLQQGREEPEVIRIAPDGNHPAEAQIPSDGTDEELEARAIATAFNGRLPSRVAAVIICCADPTDSISDWDWVIERLDLDDVVPCYNVREDETSAGYYWLEGEVCLPDLTPPS